MTSKNYDLEVFARTLYGESEPNNFDDAEAIASVVMNRVKLRNWPDSPSAVCLQPWQFSCNNPGDPNKERIAKVTKSDKWFVQCLKIAQDAIDGNLQDPTHRSTHYYATYIKRPKWAKEKIHVYEVKHRRGGAHVYFNNIDTKPPETATEALDQIKPLESTSTAKAVQAGAVGLAAVGTVSEAAQQAMPALQTAQMLSEFTPWALFIVALAVIGFLMWKLYDDRQKGKR